MWSPDRLHRNEISIYLRNQYRAGINPELCIGFHGTSLYTLQTIIETGRLPGATGRDHHRVGSESANGDIYFWPDGTADLYGNDAMTSTKGYAETIAQKHHLATLLGFPIHDYQSVWVAMWILSATDEERQKLIDENHLQFTLSQISKLAGETYAHRGILLGISKHVVNERFPIIDTNPDDGSRIETNGHGLPYQYIVGIEALGPIEQKFFANL